jgi:hypothetical protein
MNSVCKQFCSASASAPHNVGRLPATLSRSLLVRQQVLGPLNCGKKPQSHPSSSLLSLQARSKASAVLNLSANASALRGASSVSTPRSDRRLTDLNADKSLISAREIRPRISGLLIVTVCPYQSIGILRLSTVPISNDLANNTCQIVIIVSVDNPLPSSIVRCSMRITPSRSAV